METGLTFREEKILALQTKLRELGYNCVMNGKMTGNTANAFKEYCADVGIPSVNLLTTSYVPCDLAPLPLTINRPSLLK